MRHIISQRIHRIALALFVLFVGTFAPSAGAHADAWRPLFAPESPPPPAPPIPRLLHTAIYDPLYGRMIVYGGLAGGNVFSDVYSLKLDEPSAWVVIVPGAGLPQAPPRRDHVAVYDAPRNRMIVFGGCTTEQNFSATKDVFSFDLGASPHWTKITPDNAGSGPQDRFSLCGIYDPVRERLVIFGGASGAGEFLSEVWTLSLSGTPHWTLMNPSGIVLPSARDAMSAVYDPVRDRMLVFGGWDGGDYLNDTWALSLAGNGAWEHVTTGGDVPSPRRHPALAYDAAGDRLLVTGGFDGTYLNDLYALSLGGGTPTWSLLPGVGAPAGRFGHRAVYDPVGERLVFFGGYGAPGGVGTDAYLSDTWGYGLAPGGGWASLPSDSLVEHGHPGARRDHVAVVDAPGDRMIVFGGSDGTQLLNDTWALPLSGDPGWVRVDVQGPAPTPRFSLAGAMDTTRRRLLVFGGSDGSAFLNQLWALNLSGTPAWTSLTPFIPPAPVRRDAMSAVYDPLGDRLVLFGGWSGTAFLNDLWSFEFSGSHKGWHLLDAGPGPSARRHYGLAYDASTRQMILSGGETGVFADSAWSVHNVSDTWALDLDPAHTPAWTLLNDDTTGVPTARNGQRAFMSAGGRFLEFGGSNDIYRNDTWSFGPIGVNAWSELSLDDGHGLPEGRTLHTLAYDAAHSRALLYGGEGGGGVVRSDLWELRLDTESGAGKIVDAPFGGTVALAIRRIAPNPAHGPIDVWFTLPRAGGATLGLYDVAGRRVLGRDLGTMPAGEHRENLTAAGAVAPGVYFVVLSQDGIVRRTKVAILQ
jgi:hypothetical protein